MDKEELTTRQQQILDYIRKCIEVKHYPPSVREIGQAIGLSSPSTVHAHLNALEAKGFIKRDGAKSRSMVITGSKDEARERAKVEPRTEFNGQLPRRASARRSRRRRHSDTRRAKHRGGGPSPHLVVWRSQFLLAHRARGFHDQRGHL